jgi:hypothetical protein
MAPRVRNLSTNLEVSGLFHVSIALIPGKEPPAPIG